MLEGWGLIEESGADFEEALEDCVTKHSDDARNSSSPSQEISMDEITEV